MNSVDFGFGHIDDVAEFVKAYCYLDMEIRWLGDGAGYIGPEYKVTVHYEGLGPVEWCGLGQFPKLLSLGNWRDNWLRQSVGNASVNAAIRDRRSRESSRAAILASALADLVAAARKMPMDASQAARLQIAIDAIAQYGESAS